MADPGEDIHDIKRAAQENLLVLPGVHAVGVGPKIVGGKSTGELAIKVYLVQKKPLSELSSSEVIPTEINGVKTDVVEMAVPVLRAADLSKERPLILGTSMMAKNAPERGTLGFLAHTNEPQPQLVAVTCQHVVAPPMGAVVTKLTCKLPTKLPTGSPNPYTFTFTGSNTPGSLVVVRMISPGQIKRFNAYWTTTDVDIPSSIAKHVIDAINAIQGAKVTAAPGPNAADVVITTNAGADTAVVDCIVYDPVIPDPESRLIATIVGNVVTLSGATDGQYAIYTSWNTNGSDPTHGAFTPVIKGSALIAVASDIASAINATSIAGITATASGATVTVAGAAQVLCQVASDIRAGQPTDGFSSNCSLCCSDEIGRVVNAHVDLDVALVQLIKGLNYQDDIKGNASSQNPKPNTVVTGVHTVTNAEQQASYPINKRGASTQYTSGVVDSLDVKGYSTNSGPVPDSTTNETWTVFYRFYDSAMIIKGNPGETLLLPGDSGSPVFNNSGEIVGVLFAGDSPLAIVTPIDQITTNANLTVVTAAALGQTQTVGDTEGAVAMVRADRKPVTQQVLEAQAEIAATPVGKVLTDLVRRHSEEVQTLVNTNARVATVWHRNGGPKIAQVVFRYLQEQSKKLPDELDGLSLKDSLKNIQHALMKYGSDALSIDLRRYGPQILEMTNLSYAQLLVQMSGPRFFSNA